MASKELMFVFEIAVEELKSFSNATNYHIRARFGNVFTLQLKDPNQQMVEAMLSPRRGGKKKHGVKLRHGKMVPKALSAPLSQSALVLSDIESLIQSMLQYPIELTHYSKDEPFVLGIAEIPWTPLYIDYLKELENNSDLPPVVLRETYKTYDEYTSKRVAVIKLKIQLSQVKNNFALTTQIRSKRTNENETFAVDNTTFEPGTIRTIYSGGKHVEHSRKKDKIEEKHPISESFNNIAIDDKDKLEEQHLTSESHDNIAIDDKSLSKTQTEVNIDNLLKPENNDENLIFDVNENLEKKQIDAIIIDDVKNTINRQFVDYDTINHADNVCRDIVNQIVEKCIESANNSKHRFTRGRKDSNSVVHLIRSQTHIDSTNLIGVTKHWSTSSIEIKERLDTLNYIFGNLDGPFGNRVYCVGYFTVENDRSPGKTDKSGSKETSGTNTPKSGKGPSELDKKKPKEGSSTPGTPGSEKGTSKLDKNKQKGSTSPPGSPRSSIGDSSTPASGKSTPKTDKSKEIGSSSTPGSAKGSSKPDKKKREIDDGKYAFNICGKKCAFGGPKNPCFEEVCNLDVPLGTKKLIEVKRCSHVDCDYRNRAASMTDPNIDEVPILVDFSSSRMNKDCCLEKVEKVVGGMSAKLTNDPCLCTCECTFGFIKKTTYCNICGGFEVPGEEMKSSRGGAPFPCPIYHGIVKGKKGLSKKSSGMTADESDLAQSKSDKKKKKSFLGESGDSDKEAVKRKRKRRKDPRFKFNYGYKGIPPQIGHSQCMLPCTGDINPVPKHMGWLWTANNIPGLKVRPNWRPGAANKHVVRMLRNARFPEEIYSKRRKKDTGKKKRPLKRPLLIVQKKDYEYNVTMETMKTYNKPRAINQYPYEDKPLVQYTIGRTDEENAERKKRRERAQRRLEREQRAFLQSAFHDMCKEICLKTYQQALGMLPFAEDSYCPCYPEDLTADRIDESHSCSCTESTRSSGSMTDDDEWVIEFTPPTAFFNPSRSIKKILTADNSTQYTYLDYRVKLLDHYGNHVPRFFTGPDGKQQCSDLGGFWSADKKWLEINVDGYIAPDAKWAPNSFFGPCGEYVDAETGKFQSANGVWLTVGVDGYVDGNLKWHFYPQPKIESKDPRKQRNVDAWRKAGGCPPDETNGKDQTYLHGGHGNKKEKAWSCFGDVSPRTLSQMGVAGHGHDRRLLLSTLKQLLKQGEDVTIPGKYEIPKAPGKRIIKKPRYMAPGEMHGRNIPERTKCKHGIPSKKGIVAVNDRGHKTYFEFQEPKNLRPKQRLQVLGEGGISLSPFHVPCLSSFINSEMARKQQIEHILQHNARVLNQEIQTN